MKLVTYDSVESTGPRAGVIVDTSVLDVTDLLRTEATVRDVQALVELPDALDRLRNALAQADATYGLPLTSVRLRSPVLQPPTLRDFMAFEGHATGGGTRKVAD